MRVLQINTLGRTMSTGRTTRELHNYLLEHGHESFIACPTNEDSDDVFHFTSLNKLRISTALTMVTGNEITNLPVQNYKLINYIDRIHPDVVHLRVLHGCGVNFNILLSYLAKNDIPTVISMHDFWYMTGKCTHFTSLQCDKWKSECNHCPFHNTVGRKQLFDRSRYMHNEKKKLFGAIPRMAVIGVSDWVTNQVRDSFLGNAAIVQRIYNWIDLNVFYPRETTLLREKMGWNNKYIILGVASSWKEHNAKGYDTYLELSQIIPENYQIVLVGSNLVSSPLPKNLSILPKTTNTDELANIYSMADVYLNLSAEETFGKAAAEAVSCGTPIIAYDSTANSEIVPPNGGLLLQTLNAEEILDKVKMIFKHSKEEYCVICRNYAEENFDRENNIKEYIKIYRKLIEM